MKTILSALSLVLLSTSLASAGYLIGGGAIDPDKASRPGGYYEQAHSLKSLVPTGDSSCPRGQVRNDAFDCVDIVP